MKKLFEKNRLLLIIIGIIIIISAVGSSIYFFLQYKKSQDILKNPTLASQIEVQLLITKVGQLIDLPKDEQPTIATVSDYKKLQDQPFFSKAKNGFKVLIYTKAKEAILYDPIANKIIQVAPVTIGQTTPTTTPIKVAIYNGTTVNGLANSIEKQLQSTISNILVTVKDKANRDDYSKTIVIDLNGDKQEAAVQLAQLLGGKVTSLPQVEVRPSNADILIIAGK
jgi:hypothetical protein